MLLVIGGSGVGAGTEACLVPGHGAGGRRDVSICYKLPAATITLIIADKTNCCNDNEDNFVWLLTIDCLTKKI